MRIVFLLLFLVSCLFSNVAFGYEVRTRAKAQSDRVHYPEYAHRMQATVKGHPPVTDCTVTLHSSTATDIIDRVHIAIEIDQEKLHDYFRLNSINPKDQDRYLENLRSTVRKSAQSLFTEVKQSAVVVEITVRP